MKMLKMNHRFSFNFVVHLFLLSNFLFTTIISDSGIDDLRDSKASDEKEIISHSGGADGGRVGSIVIEPPKRPTNFRNLEELNQYLAEMRQFYSILGRPRYGRSTRRYIKSRPAGAVGSLVSHGTLKSVRREGSNLFDSKERIFKRFL